MAAYTFSIQGAWEVVGDTPRDHESLEEARAAAADLIVRLQGDYPGAYWASLPWRIEVADESGQRVSIVEATPVTNRDS